MDIGDLVARMLMDSKGFVSGAHEASHAYEEMGHKIKDVTKEIATVLGIGFGVERFAEGIKGQIEEVAHLGHEAAKLDVGVNSLIALKHEAAMSHVEFESLAGGMKKMQVNLAESFGSGEKMAAFKNIGVDVEKIIGLGADKEFEAIAEAISHLAGAEDRAEAARKIFGKGGIELMNMLRQGGMGVEEARNYVEKFGLAVSEMDMKKIEEADQAMIKLGDSMKALYRTLAIDLAPKIAWVADKLAELGKLGKGGEPGAPKDLMGKTEGFGAQLDRYARLGLGTVGQATIGVGGDYAKQARGELDRQNAEKMIYEEAQAQARADEEKHKRKEQADQQKQVSLAKDRADMGAYLKQNDELVKQEDELAKHGEQMESRFATPVEKAKELANEAREMFKEGAIGVETMTRALQAQEAAIVKENNEAIKPFVEHMEKMKAAGKEIFESTRTPLEKYEGQMQKLEQLHKERAINDDTFNRAKEQEQTKLVEATFGKSSNAPLGKLYGHEIGSREALSEMVAQVNGSRGVQDPVATNTATLAKTTEAIKTQLERMHAKGQNPAVVYDITTGL